MCVWCCIHKAHIIRHEIERKENTGSLVCLGVRVCNRPVLMIQSDADVDICVYQNHLIKWLNIETTMYFKCIILLVVIEEIFLHIRFVLTFND